MRVEGLRAGDRQFPSSEMDRGETSQVSGWLTQLQRLWSCHASSVSAEALLPSTSPSSENPLTHLRFCLIIPP